MNEAKAMLQKTIDELKAKRDVAVSAEFNRIRTSEVIPEQSRVESALNEAIAQMKGEHDSRLAKLTADHDAELKELDQKYSTSVAAENAMYSGKVTEFNGQAVKKKQEIESLKRAEVEARVAPQYTESIAELEDMVAKMGD